MGLLDDGFDPPARGVFGLDINGVVLLEPFAGVFRFEFEDVFVFEWHFVVEFGTRCTPFGQFAFNFQVFQVREFGVDLDTCLRAFLGNIKITLQFHIPSVI